MTLTFKRALQAGLICVPLLCVRTPAGMAEEASAKSFPAPDYTHGARLTLLARFPDSQITGVAVSKEGRMFVNLPRWTRDVPISVAEVVDGKLKAFPRELECVA